LLNRNIFCSFGTIIEKLSSNSKPAENYLSAQPNKNDMKKLSLMLGAIAIVFIMASCSSTKEARNYKKTINGTWQLQTITTEGITGKIKAQVLDEADFNCFVGSTWNFNQYNNLGYYSISQNGGECVAVKRNIRWSIVEGSPSIFQYKRVDDKYRAIDEARAGFKFTVVNLTNNNMQLRSDITFEGKPAAFIYNFTRN
jgi:hypothetical protein